MRDHLARVACPVKAGGEVLRLDRNLYLSALFYRVNDLGLGGHNHVKAAAREGNNRANNGPVLGAVALLHVALGAHLCKRVILVFLHHRILFHVNEKRCILGHGVLQVSIHTVRGEENQVVCITREQLVEGGIFRIVAIQQEVHDAVVAVFLKQLRQELDRCIFLDISKILVIGYVILKTDHVYLVAELQELLCRVGAERAAATDQ